MGAGLVEEATRQEALSAACAAGSTVRGIDVSYYQGAIDWDRVAESGSGGFAFIRVSDGREFQDSRFERNWAEAQRVGVPRGTYQFFRPSQDPIAQAELLLERMGPLQPGDLPPVLDLETTSGMSASSVRSRARQWLDHVEEALGVKPIIYTSPYFWRDSVGAPSWGAEYPLWLAHYTSGCPLLPEPWSRWDMHQYTDSGAVPGIAGGVDTNRFNGSVQDLEGLRVAGDTAGTIPVEVYWAREATGTYKLHALAPDAVVRVEYRVDGYPVGSSTRALGDNFPARYRFTEEGTARDFEVVGYNNAGATIARGTGLIDVTSGSAVYLRQMGEHLYEVGLERAPRAVAAIEVDADEWPLSDQVSGAIHSERLAVRYRFTVFGERRLSIRTYNADGSLRGTLRRSFVAE
jgi:GH25 family lysozyme M1 (1,4-beta-N-acetylmuramidase)